MWYTLLATVAKGNRVPATLRRLLNELPTIAVIAAGILGLNESDAAVWQEAAASLAALVTWIVVRASSDGPVTLVEREVRVRKALKNIEERRQSEDGHGTPDTVIWLLVVVILVIVLVRLI